jgi:hypothetical protein
MRERAALLERIAGLIGAGVARVLVDGVDGVGKSTFAAALTAALPAGRARVGRRLPPGPGVAAPAGTGFAGGLLAVTVARMARRDGRHPDPGHPSQVRYVQGQRLYFAACRPWERADLVIDNTDVEHPVLLSPYAGPA